MLSAFGIENPKSDDASRSRAKCPTGYPTNWRTRLDGSTRSMNPLTQAWRAAGVWPKNGAASTLEQSTFKIGKKIGLSAGKSLQVRSTSGGLLKVPPRKKTSD